MKQSAKMFLLVFFCAMLGLRAATPVLADQFVFDDMIVDGSWCVGMDCINEESFDFDTIRLKENNLRIHFQDTSSSASFPSNDWRIIINDIDNFGSSHFSVEDVSAGTMPFSIEAGADNDTLVVDSGGGLTTTLQGFTDTAGRAVLTWKTGRRETLDTYTATMTGILENSHNFNPALGTTAVSFVLQ